MKSILILIWRNVCWFVAGNPLENRTYLKSNCGKMMVHVTATTMAKFYNGAITPNGVHEQNKYSKIVIFMIIETWNLANLFLMYYFMEI